MDLGKQLRVQDSIVRLNGLLDKISFANKEPDMGFLIEASEEAEKVLTEEISVLQEYINFHFIPPHRRVIKSKNELS